MTGIQAIQPNNIFRVSAINQFDNQRQNGAAAEKFDNGLFSFQGNDKYSPNHPMVKGSQTQARHLDLLA